MKRLFLALLFSLITNAALAQNPTCPTRPVGDNSNACASTAFVSGGGAIAAPGVFTNTQQNDLSTFLLNGISPSTEFSTHQGGNFATEALAAGVLVPNTSTVYQVNGIASYVKSNAAQVSTGGYVGGYFSSFANANNANMFGINAAVGDFASLSGVKLQNELDFNVNNTGTVVTGISMQMSGTAQSTSATALACQTPASAGKIWSTCLFSADGAVTRGAYLGTNGTANSVPSQQLQFGGRDAGGTIRTSTINGDLNGVLQFNGGALAVASGGTGDTGTAWTAFTPSLVCGTATFTVNSARFKTMGKTTWSQIDFTITAIGTCTRPVAFTTPNTVNSTAFLAGTNTATNKGVGCVVFNPTTANCDKADATNWLVNDRAIASGVYENQ